MAQSEVYITGIEECAALRSVSVVVRRCGDFSSGGGSSRTRRWGIRTGWWWGWEQGIQLSLDGVECIIEPMLSCFLSGGYLLEVVGQPVERFFRCSHFTWRLWRLGLFHFGKCLGKGNGGTSVELQFGPRGIPR